MGVVETPNKIDFYFVDNITGNLEF